MEDNEFRFRCVEFELPGQAAQRNLELRTDLDWRPNLGIPSTNVDGDETGGDGTDRGGRG